MTLRKPHWRSLVVAAMAAAAGACAAKADPCRPAKLEPAGQAVANDRLELELADGRVIKLAGVESPPARRADPRFMASAGEDLTLWTSAPLMIAVLKPQPDRWSRHEGRAFLFERAHAPDTLPSLSEAIVDAGLARVDPGSERRPCLDRLYAAEQRARAARRGLWADPSFEVLDAAHPAGFRGRAGAMAIVEGRVASVRAGRGVTFVNMGDGAPESPALTIGRDAMRAMEREGLKVDALARRHIRARGVLDLRAGPRLEIAGPGAIELLPTPVAER
ncbi:MAG: hypothetical protein K2Y29_17540 [Beijerinckiaceae bacterium]|nr:hypothetical protein [Beijerinckiaceae bacterium]